MSTLFIAIIAILGLVLAIVSHKYITANNLKEKYLHDNIRLQERLTILETESEKEIQKQKQSEEKFKAIASEILLNNSKIITQQQSDSLQLMLSPLQTKLAEFSKQFTEAYSNEARERYSLQEKIRELIDVNRHISQDARDLTNALKGDNKLQGDWGEMILQRLLEKSGLKKDIHFTIQQTTDDSGQVLRNNEGKSLRPDVVIHYPDDRCLIIDSKVSLKSYIDFVNASNSNETQAIQALDLHVLSLRRHIKELAEKNYQDYVGNRKTDFVMMFIPNEGAYLAALNHSPSLWEEAYDRRVIILSPTHLISALKLIEQLWRQDDIKRNVDAIAQEAGRMYDKFAGFAEDLLRIDRSLDIARQSYDQAVKKLSTGNGNLIKRAERLRQMGAKNSKSIPSQFITEGSDNED